MKLNLGAGEFPLDGYINLDGHEGHSLYPLAAEHTGATEIRASHVLEHFPHALVPKVVAHWAERLAPGGVLKIAVPDFETIARKYLAGEPLPAEGYIMGAQADALDFHRSLFDAETLEELLRASGLVNVRRWSSEIPKDCAALDISLNLAATKPGGPRPKVAAVMSVPRLGFMDNMGCVAEAARAGIPVRKATGAFWGQCITRAIEESIAEYAPDWILTIDYDSVWTRRQLEALFDLAARHPEADAIAPVQCKRASSTPLFFIRGADGKAVTNLPREALAEELVPVTSAHFGLTLIRVSAIQALEKPWFCGRPAPDGSWGDGKLDDDIWFWQRWEAAGRKCYLAPRVPIGHAELMVMWPDQNLEPTFQHPSQFWNHGAPENVWR